MSEFPSQEMKYPVFLIHDRIKNKEKHRVDAGPSPSVRIPHPQPLLHPVLPEKEEETRSSTDTPALLWPRLPEGTCEAPPAPVPELFACPHLLLLTKGHFKASRAENVLKKIKTPSRGELKCVSDGRNGWQFRVSFIKLAIRPIIYHHVFFTAVSQAVITKGNRFIPWAWKQDKDGWWNLQGG